MSLFAPFLNLLLTPNHFTLILHAREPTFIIDVIPTNAEESPKKDTDFYCRGDAGRLPAD